MAKDRKLSLESEQISFSGAIELPLLGRSVAAITFRDVTGDGERREHHRVGRGFRFSARGVAYGPQHFAAENDGFLPDLEIADASSHGGQDGEPAIGSADQFDATSSGVTRGRFPGFTRGPGTKRVLQETELVIFFTSASPLATAA